MPMKQIILSTIEHSNTDSCLDDFISRMLNELASDAPALIHRIYGNWRKVDWVSGELFIKEQIASTLLHFILELKGLF
jgi:hypothetical protein